MLAAASIFRFKGSFCDTEVIETNAFFLKNSEQRFLIDKLTFNCEPVFHGILVSNSSKKT